jgi:hypothetical protein
MHAFMAAVSLQMARLDTREDYAFTVFERLFKEARLTKIG